MKRIFAIAVILCLVAGILCACSSVTAGEPKEEEIKAICELATIKCYYNNVAKITKEKDNIFQKDREMWMEFEAEVAIGIDMKDVSMIVAGNVVEVKLPQTKVLTQRVVEDSFRYVSSTDGWLVKNKITVEDEQKAVIEAEKQVAEYANNNTEAFALAEKRAKELIENYINELGKYAETPYTINWK